MQELDPQQLQAALEDAQASLAAAFARIEAFRLREKKLMSELSGLRTTVHSEGGGHYDKTIAGPGPSSEQQQDQSPWLACGPMYVTNCQGPHPIQIITSSGNKVPGSLVITGEWIDFVEVKARIHQHEFVGITTLKGVKGPTGAAAAAAAVSPAGRLASALTWTSGPPSGGTAGGSRGGTAVAQDGQHGVWQMLWKTDDVPHRLAFEADSNVREALHRHTESWMGIDVPPSPRDTFPGSDSTSEQVGQRNATSGATTSTSAPSKDVSTKRPNSVALGADVSDCGGGELQVPRNLVVGPLRLALVGEPSGILTPPHLHALACAVPAMERMRDWGLTYSTSRHGISLQTMYRRMSHGAPTVLVVKDTGGYVFGCYTPESWHIAPRFYGSGETFVFQLEPHRVHYPWCSLSHTKNDFFQYATTECVAVGGLGHFAIWLDAELLHGSSGQCGTFGSPCLAHREDFRIASLEAWQALG